METSPSIIPQDEDARLAAVRRYEILDTPRDGAFDRVTQLAARLFRVPISIVSIVDEDRIWFKSRHGIDAEQVGRDPGLCASAILQHEPLVVADASVDPNALANPLVAGEFGLRFYAGAPLRTWDGHNLGTICVIDREPREIGDEDTATLEHLAAIVVHELEFRLATRTVVESEREKRALDAARHGLEAAERERTRWARELHDETLQNLGALHMLLVSGLEHHREGPRHDGERGCRLRPGRDRQVAPPDRRAAPGCARRGRAEGRAGEPRPQAPLDRRSRGGAEPRYCSGAISL